MRISHLIRRFMEHDQPPKPMDVARHLMESGVEEEILFVGVELDTSILRGFLVQTTEPRNQYDSRGNGRVSKVYYAINQEFEWQRLVTCKELLHILDQGPAMTSTPDQVIGLVRKIILPPRFQIEIDQNGDGARALFDKVGALQAVALLFPFAIRNMLLPKYQEKVLTDDEIVRIIGLPEVYVNLVMSEFWPDIHETLLKL